MRNQFTIAAAAVVAIFVLSPATRSQDASHAGAAADISGVWQVTKYQPKMFPNGGAPLTAWGEAKFKTANPETNDPNLGCLPTGVPRLMFVPLPLEIVQTPTRVVDRDPRSRPRPVRTLALGAHLRLRQMRRAE